MDEYRPVDGKFEMPELPYRPEDLKVISADTINYHYGKHLKTYIDNTNRLLEGSGLENLPLTDVARRSTTPIESDLYKNAAQALNHIMYFEQFTPGGKAPSEKMMEMIMRDFGSMEAMQKEMEKDGMWLFGSGWVWLFQMPYGKLQVGWRRNADNPLFDRYRPLLTFDLWEHAYYLDYRNRRADYLHALWEIVNWDVVEARLTQAELR